MLVLKKIIDWALFFIFVVAVISITYIIFCWSNYDCTTINITKTSPNDQGSKIAVMKPDSDQMEKIRIQRFLIKETYKYPFYSPQYYSDRFFIDFDETDTLTFVIDGKDTVRWGSLYIVDTVPSRMKGYNNSGTLRVTYYQDTLFQSNIENRPIISILKQISFGPIRSDCIQEYN